MVATATCHQQTHFAPQTLLKNLPVFTRIIIDSLPPMKPLWEASEVAKVAGSSASLSEAQRMWRLVMRRLLQLIEELSCGQLRAGGWLAA